LAAGRRAGSEDWEGGCLENPQARGEK